MGDRAVDRNWSGSQPSEIALIPQSRNGRSAPLPLSLPLKWGGNAPLFASTATLPSRRMLLRSYPPPAPRLAMGWMNCSSTSQGK